MSKATYRGQVIDRMERGMAVYVSRPCATWGEAQAKAERKARRLGGDRYAVRVMAD